MVEKNAVLATMLSELDQTELGVLLYLVTHTMGPKASIKWSVIRDGLRDHEGVRGMSGLKDYDDNALNVKITRALNGLCDKEYIVKGHEGRNVFYAVEDMQIRKAVHEFYDSDQIMLHVDGVIPVPGYKVKDFWEFREYIVNHGLFFSTLAKAYSEYQEMWIKSNLPNNYDPSTEPDEYNWEWLLAFKRLNMCKLENP